MEPFNQVQTSRTNYNHHVSPGIVLKTFVSFTGNGHVVEYSVWQMTAAERNNAATLIQFTTVRPFTYMGFTFKCFYCTQYYSEVGDLLVHTSTHTINDREILLKEHIPRGKRVLPVDISVLKCRLCEQSYPDLNMIRRHLETEHGKDFQPAGSGMTEYKMTLNSSFNCHIRGNIFHCFALLSSHMYSHVGKVVCESCGVGFPNQHLLSKHADTHGSEQFPCKFCDKVFTKKSQLRYHTEIVHKSKERVKPRKCPYCSLTFKEHYSKMVHLKLVHGVIKNFSCHLCTKEFHTRRALTEHTTKLHTEKFKCEICFKCYSSRSKLQQHVFGHNGERNFVCSVCNKAFMHKITLKKHMRDHGHL